MKIKVCGMGPNLKEVAGLEPDYLGLIFWKPSLRYYKERHGVDVDLPKIGVFVDADVQEVREHVRIFGLDGVQLHGSESPAYCEMLKKELATVDREITLIKAFQVDPGFQFEPLKEYVSLVDYFLFDAKGELPGGNGIGFNWELLNAYEGYTPYFLSGGIGPDDAEQIRAFLTKPVSANCHAIDVNSGFEIEPGLKDIERLKPFVAMIQKLEKDLK